MKKQLLNQLYSKICNCKNCKLYKTRTKFVFGEGNPDAKIMFIGEGPGKNEDLDGRPFIGQAGQVLTDIIEKGMLLRREDVYIANIVKCRPTHEEQGTRDRAPDKEEVAACGWILKKQIDIIGPKVIITLGNPATHYILATDTPITKIRGTFFTYKESKVMPTYHPSYVKRNSWNSEIKAQVWEDIKQVLTYLEMQIPGED